MSETFRNTTFLIAIRDAGFVCNELLRVYGGIDASAKWMATCSEMHAYTVSVASTGTLQRRADAAVLRRVGADGHPSRISSPRRCPSRGSPPRAAAPQRQR